MAPHDLKPITGTWLDFHHPNPREGDYWNDTVAKMTADDWQEKIFEMSAMGFTSLVALSVALRGKTFYPSKVIESQWEAATKDPVNELFSAAEKCGAGIFLGLGYFAEKTGDHAGNTPADEVQRAIAEELVDRYGHYKSFEGWYYPVEAGIWGHFSSAHLEYANTWAALCRKLTPGKPILIAPYGTPTIQPDSKYVDQLRNLDVDYIAYQDQVGVERCSPDELGPIFSELRKAHEQAGRSAIWADLEVFSFEGDEKGYRPLVPAPFERVKQQIENLSPHVERILCYQYWGLMNSPLANLKLGHPDSVQLYEDYKAWKEGIWGGAIDQAWTAPGLL